MSARFFVVVRACCIALAVLTAGAYAQWELVGAPEGQRALGIEYVDGTVLVRTWQVTGSLWDNNKFSHESNDGGSQWVASGFVLPGGADKVTDPPVCIDGKLYAHCDGGMYWSDDKGGTWHAMSGPSGFASDYNHLYWSGSILSMDEFVCDLEAGTWARVPTWSVGIHQFSSFAKVGDRMVAASSRTGTFYSDDDGSSWTASSLDQECGSIYTTGGRVYVVAADGDGLYVSNDGGETFARISTAIRGGFLKVVDGQLYCVDAGNNALHRISDDGAATLVGDGGWSAINDITASDDLLLVATDYGVFRSANDGADWHMANLGLGYQAITRMTTSSFEGDTLYCVTATGVWRSRSYGERWKNIGMFGTPMIDVIAHDGRVYASSADKAYVTSNGGADWSEISGASGARFVRGAPTFFVYDENVYYNDESALSRVNGTALQQVTADAGKCWPAAGYVYSSKGTRTNGFSTWQNLTGLANPENVTAGFVSTATHVFVGMMNARFDPRNEQAYRSADGISFTGFDNGLRQTVGSGGDCWLTTICVRGDTVFTFDQNGGSYPAEVKYATSTSSRWNGFENVPGKVGLASYTPIVATRRSLHFGAYRYDFIDVPEVPDTVDTTIYENPDPVLAGEVVGSAVMDAYALLHGVSHGMVHIDLAAGYGRDVRVQLFDSRGRMLWSTSHTRAPMSSSRVTVPTAGLGTGMYFIRLRGSNQHGMIKLSLRK